MINKRHANARTLVNAHSVGDVITAINGESVDTRSHDEIMAMLRAAGSELTVTVLSADLGQPTRLGSIAVDSRQKEPHLRWNQTFARVVIFGMLMLDIIDILLDFIFTDRLRRQGEHGFAALMAITTLLSLIVGVFGGRGLYFSVVASKPIQARKAAEKEAKDSHEWTHKAREARKETKETKGGGVETVEITEIVDKPGWREKYHGPLDPASYEDDIEHVSFAEKGLYLAFGEMLAFYIEDTTTLFIFTHVPGAYTGSTYDDLNLLTSGLSSIMVTMLIIYSTIKVAREKEGLEENEAGCMCLCCPFILYFGIGIVVFFTVVATTIYEEETLCPVYRTDEEDTAKLQWLVRMVAAWTPPWRIG